jgi:hypothetical protein
MKNYLLFIQVIIMSIITSCNSNKASYYRTVKLDGRYEIVGEKPILSSTSKKTDCYHFVYNQDGKVIEISYLEKGKPSIDDFFKVSKIKIVYKDGFEVRSFYDDLGYPITSSEGVYSIRLKLDKNNFRIGLFNYGINNQLFKDVNGVVQYKWLMA